jgi:AbrB family transcriptional regulator, transcriptional pleiotropic regulator of transition state genes
MIINTGIRRKMDSLGRVVIPKDIRKQFNILEKDHFSILIDEEKKEIILKPYKNTCQFCGTTENLIVIENIPICKECLEKIKSA